ncbi:hypothetical protein NHX12_030548 [Muraenolepis orangiensis]|uniref:Uncharacterized protein n=1 Tax=Muraenolepis orangiensis TaxID=630683 RepID=A0A9Q0ILR9_9TELE|nr:hypothetical protein NHX12_030548 [Muraenolepis orangiensis]
MLKDLTVPKCWSSTSGTRYGPVPGPAGPATPVQCSGWDRSPQSSLVGPTSETTDRADEDQGTGPDRPGWIPAIPPTGGDCRNGWAGNDGVPGRLEGLVLCCFINNTHLEFTYGGHVYAASTSIALQIQSISHAVTQSRGPAVAPRPSLITAEAISERLKAATATATEKTNDLEVLRNRSSPGAPGLVINKKQGTSRRRRRDLRGTLKGLFALGSRCVSDTAQTPGRDKQRGVWVEPLRQLRKHSIPEQQRSCSRRTVRDVSVTVRERHSEGLSLH